MLVPMRRVEIIVPRTLAEDGDQIKFRTKNQLDAKDLF